MMEDARNHLTRRKIGGERCNSRIPFDPDTTQRGKLKVVKTLFIIKDSLVSAKPRFSQIRGRDAVFQQAHVNSFFRNYSFTAKNFLRAVKAPDFPTRNGWESHECLWELLGPFHPPLPLVLVYPWLMSGFVFMGAEELVELEGKRICGLGI